MRVEFSDGLMDLSVEIRLPAYGGLVVDNRSPYVARAFGTRGIVGVIMVLGRKHPPRGKSKDQIIPQALD